MTQLFTAQTTDASSAVTKSTGRRTHFLAVAGTLGGGAVALEITPDAGTTWVSALSVTALGMTGVTLPENVDYRLTLSGSTGANVNAWVL